MTPPIRIARAGSHRPRDPVSLAIGAAARVPVIRDLFVDMTGFFKQYLLIKPWLVNEDLPPERE